MENVRPNREAHHAVVINDRQPVISVGNIWISASRAASVGIFLLLLVAFLYFGRGILLPVVSALAVAMTLAPLVRAANRRGISTWITALFVVLFSIGAVSLAVTALAGPVSEWIGRAPEIGATIKQKFSVLEQPLSALRQLQDTFFGGGGSSTSSAPTDVVLPVVAFVTPAAGELLVFFITLMFFIVGQLEMRALLVSLFTNRDAKLRFLRILNDVERNLASYLAVVSVINAVLGAVVGVGAWLLGFPHPAIFGLLAAVFNYVPYVGPAAMVIVLFAVGLVTFPSLSYALLAPIGFVALTTAEGQVITPMIVGRRLTLNPLLVFLALAFWTWMWGPVGAFLAAPLSIVALVVVHHLFPNDDVVKLPD